MALPASGVMKASMIMEELEQSSGPWSINATASRELAEVPSGVIKFSDFYSKSKEVVIDYTGTLTFYSSGRPSVGQLGTVWNGYDAAQSLGSLTPTSIGFGEGVIEAFWSYVFGVNVGDDYVTVSQSSCLRLGNLTTYPNELQIKVEGGTAAHSLDWTTLTRLMIPDEGVDVTQEDGTIKHFTKEEYEQGMTLAYGCLNGEYYVPDDHWGGMFKGGTIKIHIRTVPKATKIKAVPTLK